jgi:beta-lactamase regulating signal transducer with metallopeptidase domain
MMSSPGLFALPTQSIEWIQLLLDLAIKGIIILLVAGALVTALKKASAAARHLLWSVAVASLLALPVCELTLPDWRVPVFPALLQSASAETESAAIRNKESNPSNLIFSSELDQTAPPSKSHTALKEAPSAKLPTRKTLDELPALPPYQTPLFEDVQREAQLSPESPKKPMNWAMVILMIWSAGFLAVMARLVAGTFKVWRIARRAVPLTEEYWVKLLKQLAAELRLPGNIRLLKSGQVTMPMTWGVWQPVVLLPKDAQDWSHECCRIVLLHELAHIKRRDCLTQTLAQLACALYWFNPLVWSAAKRLRLEREVACDDQVLEIGTRATDYASHLVAIAHSFEASAFASSMTVGMACSQLESRVVSILNPNIKRRGLNRFRILSASILAVFLVVPLAIVQPWVSAAVLSQDPAFNNDSTAFTNESPEIEKPLDAYLSQVAEAQIQKTVAMIAGHQEVTNLQLDGNGEKHHLQEALALPANLMTEAAEQQKTASNPQANEPSSPVSAEQSQQMKLFGITPEFIESVRKMGFDNLSVNQLVQMRVHKIDEEFIKQARAWGFNNATLNQLVQLRVAGVTTDYIETLKRAGFDNLSINKLAALKMHNVTPDFIDEMRRQGFDKLSIDLLLSLKVHNINTAFINEVQSWGYGKLSLNELLQVRIHNVTPNFAQEMKAFGFDNLPFNKLVQLKVRGVSAEYLKEMRSLGFENLTIDQLMQMRMLGVSAEYVKKLQAAGFKNVSVNQLIEMKQHGIDEILLKNSR